MKRIATILSVIVIVASVVAKPDGKAFELPSDAVIDKQDNKRFGLPSDAVILEEQSLESGGHADRALILWMVNPTKKPSGAQGNQKYDYTCQDETRGSYYIGRARVSLLNTKTRTVINTIEIKDPEGQVSLQIPYAIRKGRYYRVEGDAPESEEVKPHIIWLKDYNGDGKTLEFALFYKDTCLVANTTLIGYSERQDRVIQYVIYIAFEEGPGERSVEDGPWRESLFSEEPTSPGHWKYEVDGRSGRGYLSKYEIRYNAQKEMFEGKGAQTVDKPEKQ